MNAHILRNHHHLYINSVPINHAFKKSHPRRVRVKWKGVKAVQAVQEQGRAGVEVLGKESLSFVGSFRQASPYIVEHAKSLFVIVIPGEVIAEEGLFNVLLADLQLLHSLGIYLVVIVGTRFLIDERLRQQNAESRFHNNYRITDGHALQAAVQVASEVRMKMEGFFSKAPSVPLMRRHLSKGNSVGIRVVSGNFTTAKAKGIVDGLNFGATGDVVLVSVGESNRLGSVRRSKGISFFSTTWVRTPSSRALADVCSTGYSAGGDVLNCSTFDVGLHTAVQLKADKLICLHLDDIRNLQLPNWLPLDDAIDLFSPEAASHVRESSADRVQNGSREAPPGENRLMWDYEVTSQLDLPDSLIVSILSCHHGVRRSHLIDATVDGCLLLELYTRDGIGTMISSDFHEGIRHAVPLDVSAIEQLLKPLMETGITIRRSYEELLCDITQFRVFEKEQRILGCALVKLLDEEHHVAELAALCVHPDCRGQGKGDALLTYIEEELHAMHVQRLVILTTRTADWFLQRGFLAVGPAHSSGILPASRLAKIDPSRNSQLYVKTMTLD